MNLERDRYEYFLNNVLPILWKNNHTSSLTWFIHGYQWSVIGDQEIFEELDFLRQLAWAKDEIEAIANVDF